VTLDLVNALIDRAVYVALHLVLANTSQPASPLDSPSEDEWDQANGVVDGG
jgi:hypothetical protein